MKLYMNKLSFNGLYSKTAETEKNMSSNNSYNAFIKDAVDKLKSLSEKEATKFLIDSSKGEDGFKMIQGVLFKHEDYTIQNLLRKFGDGYNENLKILNKIGLKIVPEHLETISKENEMYIVSRIPGTKTGELIPLWKGGYDKVPKEKLLDAYNDLKKLTQAGYVDDRILRSNELWFYTPDDNSIMLPAWSNLRKIRPDESRTEIIQRYHDILFRPF